MVVSKPTPDEYHPFQLDYISRVPEGVNILAMLAAQPVELRALVDTLDDAHARAIPTPGEWSIKEVLQHISDTERILAFRALAIARGEQAAIPGFEQVDYAAAVSTVANNRSVGDLLAEFELIRAATLPLVRNLAPDTHMRATIVSGKRTSVRTWLHVIAGHVASHIESLKTVYGRG
jgi:hypothetical protein